MREAIKQTLIDHGVTDISGALLDELAAKQADAVREAVEALEPFARAAADQIEGNEPDNCDIWEHGLSVAVTFGDFRRAAAAFTALKGERP